MKKIFILFYLFAISLNSKGQDKTIVFDEEILTHNKAKSSNTSIKAEITKLKREADKFLDLSNLNVTTKIELPPSKDKHDFYSLSIYWWPNPKTSDGLPYIPKDGQPNPGRLKIKDLSNLIQISKAVKILGLTYYYTSDKKYSTKVQQILSIWFLNQKTKMNPNLNFSGSIPGVSNGRPEGIIDGRYFIELIDGMILAQEGISDETFIGVRNWFREYNNWLENSSIGKQGKNLTNNIGTSYYLQRLTCLRLLGENIKAKNLIKSEVIPLMNSQFDSEGGQILENKRTRSWTYSIANLKYWFNISKIADDLGIDLISKGPLSRGYYYLQSYTNSEKKWNKLQIKTVDYNTSLNTLIPYAERRLDKKNINSKISKMSSDFILSEIKF